MFRTLVSPVWNTKKSPTPVYVDLVRVTRTDNGVLLYRWHGWVDNDSRQIVQEG
jgi:hypothetical protein